jgi:hypothetical protein
VTIDSVAGDLQLLASDMRNSEVLLISPTGEGNVSRVSTAVANPAAACAADLNRDGTAELLIAELGSLLPQDHDRGAVLWLADGVGGAQPPVPLLSGIGRVADVSVGDFNGDGREDLVVAEFGWHQTGSIHLMLQQGVTPDGVPEFKTQVLDHRPGAIHVPVCDLNQDGRLDFIALISQEFEVIEAYLGNGDGTFVVQRIDDAGDPAFGSSGIQVVDLDRDGDLDVLSTNGDTFDSQYVKPYHGVRWLENAGDFPFRVHELSRMPGVNRALAADFDLDGDLDVAACSLLPAGLRGEIPADGFDSVNWLEQVSPGQFKRHSIERNNSTHAAMYVNDLNRDAKPDIVVGTFVDGPIGETPVVSVFWNDGGGP